MTVKGEFMNKCFVIQPFDDGDFDRRYKDVFKPAIENAGLEAYRVDEDLNVRIPMNDIEKGISSSVMCFAEITTNNPNVWYELGYAFACEKDVIMVCSDERQDNFPFDIRHRKIFRYTTKSKSDYDKLEKEITDAITAYKTKPVIIRGKKIVQTQNVNELENHEIMILVLLMEDSISNDKYVSYYFLQQEMRKYGYTNIATSIAIRILVRKGMVTTSVEQDGYSNGETFEACKITEEGENWILSNQDRLLFKKNTVDDERKSEQSQNVPF